MTEHTRLACACGNVQIAADKSPIIAAECHCTSCRTAGRRLQSLPNAKPVLESNGGTRFVLYRKDRVRLLEGTERLAALRLTPESKTRRVVATCCDTPVFLEFESGHWLSLYAALWPERVRPSPDLRTMTEDVPDGVVLPDDVPNAKRQSLSFFVKLLGAWIAMGFKVPKITVAQGGFDA